MAPNGIDLDPLFEPETVAVVGASPDSFYSSNFVGNLLNFGFDGTFYPINPNREEVWDRTCYDSLTDIPISLTDELDLVVVSVPREAVIDVVQTAGKHGVPAALVITAGFSEADERGRELEAELTTVANEYDIHVTGPNCIGIANAHSDTVLTSTCSRKPEPGSIGLISQSGALAFNTFFERAADQDLHFSHIVSTGNEVDLSVADYVSYFADKSTIDVICTYIEGIANPERFLAAANTAIRSGTPVLAIKVGRSETAEAATLSHTGSLTGNNAAWEGGFVQAGIERVSDIPDLLSRANAHASYTLPAESNICIASTSGGLGSLLADMAAERDLSLPEIEGDTEQALLEMDDLLTFGEMHNPADIRGYGAEVLPQISDILFADDAFDAYVFALGLSAIDERAKRIADDISTIAKQTSDPVFVLWTGRKEPENRTGESLPYERLRKTVPVYYDSSRCMDAIASLTAFGDPENRDQDHDQSAWQSFREKRGGPTIDLPSETVLTWNESATLLDAYNIPMVETTLVTGPEDAVDTATELGFPVAMKINSPALPHRTDVGAVQVGITSPEAATTAYHEIIANAQDHVPEEEIEGVLVQPMITDGVETLIGISMDESFGPLVTVAAGGTGVETLEDRAIRIPPLTREDAQDAINNTRVGTLLAEHREGPAISSDDLADLLVRVGDLAVNAESVAELDLNPVVVTSDGAIAVDALVRTQAD